MPTRGLGASLLSMAMSVAACGPSVTASPSPSVVPTAAVPTTVAFQTWTRIDLPDPAPHVYGGGTPSAVAFFRSQLIAAGTVAVACCADGDPSLNRGVIWTSADGRNWLVVDGIRAFAHASLTGLVTDGSNLIAVGTYAQAGSGAMATSEPAVWVSSNGGTDWARASGPVPDYVVATAAGFLGVRRNGWRPDDPSTTSEFVDSADGLVWHALNTVNAAARALVVDPSGEPLVIGGVPGATAPDGSPTIDTVVWTPTRSPRVVMRNGLPVAATADAHGVVVAGCGGGEQKSVCRLSDSGLLPLSLAPGEGEYVLGLYALGDVLLATGDTTTSAAGNVAAWVSTDGGASWSRIPDQAALAGMDTELRAVAPTEDGLVAVGARWDPTTMHPVPVAWLSR